MKHKAANKTQPWAQVHEIGRIRSEFALNLIWEQQKDDPASRKALANNPSTPDAILKNLMEDPRLSEIAKGAFQLKEHLPPPNPYLHHLEQAGVIDLAWHLDPPQK